MSVIARKKPIAFFHGKTMLELFAEPLVIIRSWFPEALVEVVGRLIEGQCSRAGRPVYE